MGNSKYRKLSPIEIIIGASALVVSLCALFVSISQVKLSQEQAHLAVMPRIDISFSSNSAENLNVSITNCGLGPAEIMSAKIEYNSVAVGSWEELFSMMNKENLKLDNFTSSKLKNRMLVPMQIFPILTAEGEDFYKLLNANKEKIKITIIYKSFYNEYFEVCREHLGVSSAIINKRVDYVSFREEECFQR